MWLKNGSGGEQWKGVCVYSTLIKLRSSSEDRAKIIEFKKDERQSSRKDIFNLEILWFFHCQRLMTYFFSMVDLLMVEAFTL